MKYTQKQRMRVSKPLHTLTPHKLIMAERLVNRLKSSGKKNKKTLGSHTYLENL